MGVIRNAIRRMQGQKVATDIILPTIKPRWYQVGIMVAFSLGIRRIVISWPRRHGKDVISFSIMVREAMRRVGTYYYYFPTLEDGKEILWNNSTTIDGRSGMMIDLLCPPEIVHKKDNSDFYLVLINGSIIRIGGTDNLKVIGTDGIGYVYSEWQSQKPQSFDLVRPILRQNGGWVIFNGTMRGKENHLYQDVERNFGLRGWYVEWLKPAQTLQYYWESPENIEHPHRIDLNLHLKGQINPDSGLPYDNIQDEVDSGMSYATARQEYLNEAVSEYEGTYYAYEFEVMRSEGRIANFGGLKEGDRVATCWDIGLRDAMAIALFKEIKATPGKKKRFRFVGYMEARGHKYEWYFKELRKLKVEFTGHYIPHDAKKTTGESLSNFVKIAASHNFRCRVVRKAATVKADIEICRQQWSQWEIDLEGPNMGLFYEHLGKYRENKATGRPHHGDGSSHGGDASRTGQMAIALDIYSEYLDEEFDMMEGSDEWYESGEGDEIEDEYVGYSLDD
jgi:hypothetical protein